jgi:Rrf2 family protein
MMVVIARQADGSQAVSLGSVAKTTMISRRYLEQLAIGLKRHALIRGISGRTGGYVLARPSRDITVGEIVEAAIGPINIVDCVLSPEGCVKSDVCECRSVYERINLGIRDVLHSLSLEELAQSEGGKRRRRAVAVDGVSCPADGGRPPGQGKS